MRSALSALSLLTRLPVPIALNAEDLRGAATYFGAVGLLFGALACLMTRGIVALGAPLAAALLCALWAWLSGGLHLDGVADVCDGMGGGRGQRERTLEIMRDPRVGAHGVVGVALILLIKVGALARCFELDVASAALLAPAWSRAQLLGLLLLPNGRPGGLADHVRPRRPWLALSLNLVGLAALLALWDPGLWPCPLGAATAAIWLAIWAQRRLGGVTGDVLGAATEAGETAFLLTAVLSHSRSLHG